MAGQYVKPSKQPTGYLAGVSITNQIIDYIDDELGSTGSTHDGLPGMQTQTLVTVANGGDTTINMMSAVALKGPAIEPGADGSDSLAAFMGQIVLAATQPAAGDDKFGYWGVTIEPIAPKSTGLAVVSGLVQCKVNVQAVSDLYAILDNGYEPKTGATGSAAIWWLKGWKTTPGTATATGEQWAILQMGLRASGVFPVRVKQVGGSAGSSSALCSFTYDVYRLDNTTKISTSAASPKSSPCRGFKMKVDTAATYGLAFYDSDGSLQVMYCNETTGNTPCS